jgi:quinol-cytochrome oxidoreductase complex cytochrome b subunit
MGDETTTRGTGMRFPRTDRERALATRGTFLLHLRPIKLSRRTVRWTHTLGLGGSALVLWVTLAFTGILMLLVYQPVPEVAFDSIRSIENDLRFGPLVRGAHYWSANLLIAVVIAHGARVVLTGGFHRPRRLNWVIGVGLLGGVLAAAFTGYLLTWDQRAYWAVTISTGMLVYVPVVGESLRTLVVGGGEIADDTLLAFYTYHTTVLPVLAIALMGFHFWRVRKAGGVIEPPEREEASETARRPGEKILFFPDLLVREAAQALVVLAVVVVLGAFVGAPIGERANPGMSPNPAKAPWYFMGFQELLVHLDPVFAVLLLPAGAIAAFVALPWLGQNTGPAGRWFLSGAARRTAGIAAAVAGVVTVAGVLLDELVAGSTASQPGWIVRGVIPTVTLAAITTGLVVGSKRRYGLGRNEALQTALVFLFTVFATLTVIGACFRGEGMALSWPWWIG